MNHSIWRLIGRNRDAFEKHAPHGHFSVVVATVAGERIPFNYVETTAGHSWALLHWVDSETGDDPGPGDRLHFVRQEAITSVEIAFVPLEPGGARKHPPGFVRELEADSLPEPLPD